MLLTVKLGDYMKFMFLFSILWKINFQTSVRPKMYHVSSKNVGLKPTLAYKIKKAYLWMIAV